MNSLLLVLISYLIGSLPFGLWLGRVCCHIDLREHGSGNIGATNAWRVLGWKVGLPVFILDIAKGLLPVLMARMILISTHVLVLNDRPSPKLIDDGFPMPLSDWSIVACGIAAILGHNFSPFLRFKGGKGVATTLGVALGLSWQGALAGFIVWAVVLGVTRYMSIASLLGTPVGALGIWLYNGRSLPYGLFSILSTVFVIVKHKANIQRLREGTELKFGIKS